MALPEDIYDDAMHEEYDDKYKVRIAVKLTVPAWITVDVYEDADGEIDEDDLLKSAKDEFDKEVVDFDIDNATLDDWVYDA